MRKLSLIPLGLLAAALMGSGGEDTAVRRQPLVVTYLPPCGENEYLIYEHGSIVCREIVADPPNLPDCKATGQLLTATREAGQSVYRCVTPGIDSLAAADIPRIEQTYARLRRLNTTWSTLTAPSAATVVKYCGQYSATPNPNGAILGTNGITGIAGAASPCATVASCGTGARMCTVYDLYNSVVLGAFPPSLSPSWVHLSAWQCDDPAQVPTGSGLADNCSGWTYPLDDRLWYGTTVEWKDAPSGHKALHFASGPGVVACTSRFPIACCK